MVVEKLDLTVGRFFLLHLSNGDESGEKDHGNEFRGSENGGREVWIGLKWSKNDKILRPKVAVGREISRPRSFDGGAPPCPARVQWWWSESAPTAETRSA